MADAVAVGELEDVMCDKPEGLPDASVESTSRNAGQAKEGGWNEGCCPAAVGGNQSAAAV